MQLKNIFAICIISLILLTSFSLADSKKEPVDYVNTDIGGISILLKATRSVVQLPNDYPQVTPVHNPGITDNFVATKIYGFPAGGVTIMPSTGKIKTDPDEIASDFDRDFEIRTPYYYKGLLEDYNIEASYTVGHFAVFYKFDYPSAGDKYINIMMRGKGWIEAESSSVIHGFTTIYNVPYYFYLEFSSPFKIKASWNYNGKPEQKKRIDGEKIGFTIKFSGIDKNPVMIKTGLSFISLDQAKRNLDNAIKGWDFNLRKEETRAAWNNILGKIEIEGGTEKEKEIFYSSFYRSVQNMMDITEEGRYYSGFDKKVHESGGSDFYTNDQMWDTYRCNHPLQLLLSPKQQGDMIKSILRMDEQSRWLPMFPGLPGDFAAMIGQHANEVIADAYFKGCRDFDVEKAYQAMKNEAMTATKLPWKNGPMTSMDTVFLQKGFFPALKEGEKETNPDVASFERRQAVSVTLEAAYDNWCIARMAKALGHTDDYKFFF